MAGIWFQIALKNVTHEDFILLYFYLIFLKTIEKQCGI